MATRISRPWPPALAVLTVDDCLAAGLCQDGIDRFMARHRIVATAVPVEALLRVSRGGNRVYIKRAAGMIDDGYGDGYGYGDGDGYGYGYGYGDGYGDGDGYGYGYGYGNGDGDGALMWLNSRRIEPWQEQACTG